MLPPVRERIVYDLCAGTGAWSAPYAAAGYRVVRVTLPLDVRDWLGYMTEQSEPVAAHGVLCAPPCTYMANSGARWVRTRAEMLEAISVMDACLRVVWALRRTLAWWALENPVGKMRRYLGEPTLIFDPCDYGDPYTKKTLLWGSFTAPRLNRVAPTLGSKIHRYPPSEKRKELRSITPAGFARAFFESNP